SHMLAGHTGLDYDEIRWECAGINHLAWFTRWEDRNGKDLYPILMEKANDRSSDFAKAEPVRSDMMRHFGAFITESSGHLSEYVPYYRKRKDLLDKYTDTGYRGEESFYANNWPNWRKGQEEYREKLFNGEEELNTDRTWEYGAWIIEAIEKDTPFVIHGNVPNDGCIANLPSDGCIEVACLVDGEGWHPTRYGRLPRQMAAMCDWNMRMFDIAAEAAIHRSKALAKQALLLDPLTAAVCCPAEIFEMVDRLFEAEKEWLPGF
ncbi:MAG: alpha-glucosidase/alpha-galactosidase, partial [Armatimonadota bacterium]